MEEIDKITIQKAIKGDNGAFKTLYDQYSPFIWRLLFRMFSGDQNQAQELLQETFVKVYSSLNSFRSESSLSTWIYRIAYNTAMKAISIRKRHANWISYNDEMNGKTLRDCYETSEMVKKILKDISAEDRFLLISKEVDGFSYDELASITNQTAGALRTRLHRLKEQLRIRSDELMTGGKIYA
jgi:RNA polymerase sigma-70 factor, ECF subfamily